MQASMRASSSMRACGSSNVVPRVVAPFRHSHVAPARGLAAGARRAAPIRQRKTVVASVVVKDTESGVEFPLAQKFWQGDEFRCLGAGTRIKKILVISAQVYSVSLYVEAERCAKELGVRYRGGFFESEDDYAQAVLDGAFSKALIVQLLRDVTGEQFAEALGKYLGPRMQLVGDSSNSYQQFLDFFTSRELPKGIQIVMFWSAKGDLELAVVPPEASTADLISQPPALRLPSPGLARALFELYLGASAVVPDARKAWVAGAKGLLESENVKREVR